jgi:hypothetical protein
MDPDFLETLFMPLGESWPPMNFTNSRTGAFCIFLALESLNCLFVYVYVYVYSEFSFWSLWASPLLVATDPADLSDEKKAIIMNSEVIAINQVICCSVVLSMQ